MSEIWNKVYKSDNTFFGDEPSNFALLCFNHMRTNNAKKILELGTGHRRDTTFFASNALEVEALDYSFIAVEILDKLAKEKNCQLNHDSLMSRACFRFQMAILMLYTPICFSTCDFQSTNYILYFQR